MAQIPDHSRRRPARPPEQQLLLTSPEGQTPPFQPLIDRAAGKGAESPTFRAQ